VSNCDQTTRTDDDALHTQIHTQKGHSNLANGDITFLSYSPGGSTEHEVAVGSALATPILGKGTS